MSDSKREEYEQSEEVRQWLKDNIQTLVIGIAGGLALLYGWQFFQQWQAGQQQAAGEAFYQFSQAFESQDAEQAEARLKALQQDFPRSLYTVLAGMEYARMQKDSDPAKAAESLQQLLKKHGDGELANLVRVRLARLQWQAGNADAALATLADVQDPAWTSLVAEVQGDIYMEQGNQDAARTAYKNALDHLDPTSAGSRPVLEMKLDNLGNKNSESTMEQDS